MPTKERPEAVVTPGPKQAGTWGSPHNSQTIPNKQAGDHWIPIGTAADRVLRNARPVFVLRLQPLPNVDAVRSLRAVLKSLLRRHGLRCVSLEPEPWKDVA